MGCGIEVCCLREGDREKWVDVEAIGIGIEMRVYFGGW